nr:immunoglobulin heavy chain junction region [Macaca mulatta]MOW84041.1 immunoglobulin heavy chain junction region [Macaca mulatta]MOW85047.1 immunoglobulin heavy chain junction region [Macaca mulatta]
CARRSFWGDSFDYW